MLAQPIEKTESLPSASDKSARGVAIVTGGRRGIGRAICSELGAAGFDIAMVDIADDESSNETMKIIRSFGGRSAFFRRDVADTPGHRDFVSEIEDKLGAITCLVNNAGVQVAIRGDLLDVTEHAFDHLMNVNLRGTFFFTQAVARRMASQTSTGAERSLITITSANAGLVSPEKGPYCISKAGLSMASQQFALRLADAGIRVHEIRPGLIQTDMTAEVFDKYSGPIEAGALSAMRRWGQPGEIAKCVGALATGAIPFSTGDIFHIGGGMQIHRL